MTSAGSSANPHADTEPIDPTTTDAVEEIPGRAALPADVPNDDLAPGRAGPDDEAPTSDREPAAEDADFEGRPLTDAEIDALRSTRCRPTSSTPRRRGDSLLPYPSWVVFGCRMRRPFSWVTPKQRPLFSNTSAMW